MTICARQFWHDFVILYFSGFGLILFDYGCAEMLGFMKMSERFLFRIVLFDVCCQRKPTRCQKI